MATIVKIPVGIMMLYSTDPSITSYNNELPMLNKWRSHLLEKNSDPTWTFNTTMDIFDYGVNLLALKNYMILRLLRLPQIHVIHGPDFVYAQYVGMPVAAYFRIPIVPTTLSSSAFEYGQPAATSSTAFLIIAPGPYGNSKAIQQYAQMGVKTMAFVWQEDREKTSFNIDVCKGTAQLAEQYGIEVVYQQQITRHYNITDAAPGNNTKAIDLTHKALDKVIELNPDALMWCDVYQCRKERYKDYFIPMLMKERNYMPKALMMFNCLNNNEAQPYLEAGWLDFVSESAGFSWYGKGTEFTQGNTPYSSLFRPPVEEPITISESITLGSTSTSPSSTRLFIEWMMKETNSTDPNSVKVMEAVVWAACDVIEAALYRAAKYKIGQSLNTLSAYDVYNFLDNSQTRSLVGRVVFDENRINTNAVQVLTQQLNREATADIVGPSEYKTDEIVYPIPTWDERVYKWSLTGSNSQNLSVGVASVCTGLLVLIMITVTIKRKDIDIMMFNYLHINAMCACICVYCWALVLVWQADTNQTQCDLLYWSYLPIAFPLAMVTIRAYRLSLFLKSALTGKKAKPFPHSKVLAWTMIGFLLTTAIILIIALADPQKPKLVIVDKYRPKLNYHSCESKSGAGNSIIIALFCVFIVAAIMSVAAVRNGFEAFQDGVVMKEAFVIYFFSVLTYFAISQLGVSASELYATRASLMCFGSTFFMMRLMIGRCAKYWLPSPVLELLKAINQVIASFAPDMSKIDSKAYTESGKSSMAESQFENDDGSQLPQSKPEDGNLDEMMKVFDTQYRLELFRKMADQGHIIENVDFLMDVLKFKNDCSKLLVESSCEASKAIQARAKQLCHDFIEENSHQQVNVSAGRRKEVETFIQNWIDEAILTMNEAKNAIDHDKSKRSQVFDKAFKDIQIMLYQNLWNKFKVEEVKLMASGNK